MFRDYELLVVAYFHQKLALNELTLRLKDPTPASMRDECLAVYSVRNGRSDEAILRVFFEVHDNEPFSEKKIANCDISIFKPLIRYLQNKTSSTEKKNIELLAWLIDFQPRPFEFGRRYAPAGIAVSAVEVEEEKDFVKNGKKGKDKNIVAEESYGFSRRGYRNPYFKSIIISVFALAGLAIAGNWIFGWWGKESPINNLAGLQRCMYWTGNHYEQVSCNAKFGFDTLVVAYDSVTFHTMKKVTRPDTITLHSMGRLWYIKRNNRYEFFTSDGPYPPDPKARLRPVTVRILNNQMRLNQGLSDNNN